VLVSGGADCYVIIWKNTGQGLLKYNHSAPIQKVKFNPATLLLASCSEVWIFTILILVGLTFCVCVCVCVCH